MDAELLFKIVNISVLPGWILLVILPQHKITRLIVHSYVYPFLLGVVYSFLILPALFAGGDGGMGSVAELQIGFQSDLVLVGAWVHYLIFDLFIGAWESRDAQRNNIPHLVLVPCLIATLFAGPVGLMFYLAIRFYQTRKATLV